MNTVSQKVIDLFGDVYIYFKPNDGGTELMRTALGQDDFNNYLHLFSSNPTVSNAALAFAVKLGFKNIYFHGVDLGYIDPNYHHSKDSLYFEKNKKIADFDGHAQNNKIVKGNFVDTVFSSMIFDWSRHTLEHVLRTPGNEELNCYNCSNGAKIERATPLKINEIDLTDGSLPSIVDAVSNLTIPEIITFSDLCDKVEQYSDNLFELMDLVVSPDLGEVQINHEQLVEHFNYQYHTTRLIGREKNVFICRMLLGSLNYLQTTTIGKVTLYTKSGNS